MIAANNQKEEVENRVSLNGEWEIVFDDANEGRESKWMKTEVFSALEGRKSITVPSCWEEEEEDYEGVAFYSRKFTVDNAWKGQVIRLQFDAVNYLSEVYLNDNVLGYHEGGFTPFEFNVEHLLDFEGENTLTLRIVGPVTMTDKVIDGMGPKETPQWRGAYTGGIWQSVHLYATGTVYIEDTFIEPKISDGTASVAYQLNNTTRSKQTVTIESVVRSVKEPKIVCSSFKEDLVIRPGINSFQQVHTIKNPTYWSPENPYLYTVETTVSMGEDVSESQSENFGMREFTIRDGEMVLNGEPMYLKATFFEALYPVGLTNPDSREMVVKEIGLAKEAGFNMIRPWRKPPSKMWLDVADEMGILVVGSMAVECMGKPDESPYLPRRVETEIRESIMRDRNRACIVQWELFNELHRPILKNMLHPMSMVARELDPTRLILDESGGFAKGANLYLPYEFEPFAFNDIHHYPGPNINEKKFDAFLVIGKTEEEKKEMGKVVKTPGLNVKPGLMSFVSELGYGSLPNLVENNKEFEKKGNPKTPAYKYHKRLDAETKVALERTGLTEIFSNTEEYYLEQQKVHGLANRRMMEATRCNLDVGGYCIHALTGGNWVLGAEILDIWRNPKKDVFEQTQAANQKQLGVVRLFPRNVYGGSGTSLEVTGISELVDAEVWMQVTICDEEKKVIWSKEEYTNLSKGVASLLDEKIDTVGLKGNYDVSLKLSARDGATIGTAVESFFVVPEELLETACQSVAVVDPGNELTKYFEGKGIRVEVFSEATDLATPVIVGDVVDWHGKGNLEFVEPLNRFVEKGGSALYLNVPGRKRIGSWAIPMAIHGEDVLPTKPLRVQSPGLWDGILHMAHDHPVFEDLPIHQSMVGAYENISPVESLIFQEGESMVSTIAYDRFPDLDETKKNYRGVGDTWWGSDLVSIKHGEGSILLTTLKLLENLGKDAVADKLFVNILNRMS